MMDLVWMILTWLITLVFHELGHLWAARACRFDVPGFNIGIGPPMKSWRWNYTRVDIGYPWTWFVGFVEVDDGNRGTIGQRFFVASAGLVVNAVVMVFCSLGDNYLHQWSNYWAQLGILNMACLLINLVPFVGLRRGYSKVWSDGGQMLGLAQEKLTGKNFTHR